MNDSQSDLKHIVHCDMFEETNDAFENNVAARIGCCSSLGQDTKEDSDNGDRNEDSQKSSDTDGKNRRTEALS